jgi:hypothetical protein
MRIDGLLRRFAPRNDVSIQFRILTVRSRGPGAPGKDQTFDGLREGAISIRRG